ncbi:F-box domain-containing protein [Favolaschia claudopus]|uniref:F-box domain-containing protein n=1 Tax=Favolaschia claudopus TaxID=2862362 RepID=A0AAW0EB66_9AGAR
MLLPLELLDHIFSYLPPADLCVVARAGPFVYPVAVRVLYRTLTVSHSPFHAPPSILPTLARRTDLARHVRCLSVALDQSAAEFHSFLATTLSKMPALVSLDIFVDAGSWVLPENLFFPQLQHFACSFALDTRLAAFLSNAPRLDSVQIDSAAPEPFQLTPTSLLRVERVTGCASAAVAIVPGRPVESVHINSGDLTEAMVPSLAQSTSLITVLSITTSSAPLQLLEALGEHLPHLMYLRVTSTANLPAPPTSIFYGQVADALSSFPQLQSFELSGMYWLPSKADDRRQWSRPLVNTTSDNPTEPQDEVLDLDAADFLFV